MSLARPATPSTRRRNALGSGSPHREPVSSVARRAAVRVRWDRVGRVALLITLLIVVGLYIQPALSILTTWRAEHRQASAVRQLIADNKSLERQVRSLNSPLTIVADARSLGMVRTGEKPYVVLGLHR
jgi:cell division protein FtsB